METKVRVAILSNGISPHTINRLNLFETSSKLEIYFLHQSYLVVNHSSIPTERFIQWPIKNGRNYLERGFIAIKIMIQNVKNINKIKPDVIFIMYGEKLSLLSALFSKIPYVISAWGGDFLVEQGAQKTWKSRFILKLGVKNAKHIFAVSEELVHTISKLRGDNQLPAIQHAYYGIDLNLYQLKSAEKSKDFIIYAPRWCRPEYNLLGLLHAFYIYTGLNTQATLLFRNTDMNDSKLAFDYLQEANGLIQKYKIADRVKTIGVLSEKEHIKSLEKASVIISLAPSDGTPVTILEAMALGKIVVCGRINSLEKLIDDGKTGFLVDLNNPNEIAEKLNYIYQNFENLEIYIGQNARKFVEQKANIHKEIEIYIDKLYSVGISK
jgi:glycosyltransferase involved in cell wall biosynthesis